MFNLPTSILLSALILGSTLVATACSRGQNSADEAGRTLEIENLIQAVQKLESDLSQGFLLRNATDRVHTEFRDRLYKVRAAAYLLRDNPQDAVGLAELHSAYVSYEKSNLLQDDRTLLEDFLLKLRQSLEFLSSLQGTSLDGIGNERLRTLFSHHFTLNTDMGAFRSYLPAQNRAQSWNVTSCGPRCGNLEYLLAQVEKPGDETWLLSPRMILPDRDLLTLTLEGSARGPLVDAQGENSSRRFRVLVSESFSGETAKPAFDASWIDLTDSLLNFPVGKVAAQFRSFKIEANLAPFKGKTITLALRLAAGPSDLALERSETQWQINKFILQGKGDFSLASPAPATANEGPQAGLTPAPQAPAPPAVSSCGEQAEAIYQTDLSLGEAALQLKGQAEFASFISDREPKFIKLSGRIKVDGAASNKAGQTWLISPSISTQGVKRACLSFDSGLWFHDRSKTQAEVLVSFNFKDDPEAAQWLPLTLPEELYKADRKPSVDGLSAIKDLPLPEFLGSPKNFVIAFRYTSSESSAPWWGLKGIVVKVQK